MALSQSALSDLLDALRAGGDLDVVREVLARPLQAAVVSGLSFAVGAALPLALIALAPIGVRIPVTTLAALAALALLGTIGARLGGAPAGRAAVRVTLGGGLAMALTALIGQLVGATGL